MLTFDPIRLARRQIEIDRARIGGGALLFEHKAARMVASPLALLRGSAPLFYELLARHPALSEGPAGEGWIVGDAHLENFGAYRAGPLKISETRESHQKESVVFDLNDFDDGVVGPWRFDVLRLLTSLMLAGRELGVDGRRAIQLSELLLEAYVGAVFHRRRPPTPPALIARLIDRVRLRTRRELLDARTEIVRDERRFVRGLRYQTLAPKLRARAERAFAKYARRLPRADRVPEHALEVIDAAFRVAGTGSLGCLRVAVLVRGKGGRDGAWVFDMKSEGAPSSARLVPAPPLEPADRVVAAIGACLSRPPRMIGTTRLRGESMFVRRLAPQEDKIQLLGLAPGDLDPLARHLGALLGAAHKRGAKRLPRRAWMPEDLAGILARAITLAGVHEALYLAYCHRVRR